MTAPVTSRKLTFILLSCGSFSQQQHPVKYHSQAFSFDVSSVGILAPSSSEPKILLGVQSTLKLVWGGAC